MQPATARSCQCQEPTTLKLADPNFHSPGRIDLVLGENILDKLLQPQEIRTGPEGTVLSSDGPSEDGTHLIRQWKAIKQLPTWPSLRW